MIKCKLNDVYLYENIILKDDEASDNFNKELDEFTSYMYENHIVINSPDSKKENKIYILDSYADENGKLIQGTYFILNSEIDLFYILLAWPDFVVIQ